MNWWLQISLTLHEWGYGLDLVTVTHCFVKNAIMPTAVATMHVILGCTKDSDSWNKTTFSYNNFIKNEISILWQLIPEGSLHLNQQKSICYKCKYFDSWCTFASCDHLNFIKWQVHTVQKDANSFKIINSGLYTVHICYKYTKLTRTVDAFNNENVLPFIKVECYSLNANFYTVWWVERWVQAEKQK